MTTTNIQTVAVLVRHQRHNLGNHPGWPATELNEWTVACQTRPDRQVLRALGLPADAVLRGGAWRSATGLRWTYTTIAAQRSSMQAPHP